MTREEMIAEYKELYSQMATSKDVRNMKIMGSACKWAFYEMTKLSMENAEKWLSHLRAIKWNNYLSDKECVNIDKRTKNQDGVKGFHWTLDTFKRVVESLGGMLEEMPYYNMYALYVTANVIYSDHARSIAEDMGYKTPAEVPAEKMALSCYKKAVEKLKDADNPYFVREYFEDKMYDDSPMLA